MRQTHQAWLRSAASLVVLGAALAGALPAVAGTVSFSIDMAGDTWGAEAGVSAELHMMPFNGTMQPFGTCQGAMGGRYPDSTLARWS